MSLASREPVRTARTHDRLVVGYDGSPLADQALRWAACTATPTHAPIEVVVAADLPAGAETWTSDRSSYLEGMREVAERAEKQCAALGCDATVVLQQGQPATLLSRAGDTAAMLVVGALGHGVVASALVGSVSRQLAVHARCPLVVVRPGAEPEERIVVGMDDRWSCRPGLDFALQRAEHTGSRVVALHVVRAADPFSAEPPVGLDPYSGIEQIRETVVEAARAYPGVDLTVETVGGRPHSVLVEATKGASLVVLGARGRNPFARLLLGSIGQQVLHHAHCPVAIVR